jgi:hypothetical protein
MIVTTFATWKSMNDFMSGKPADFSLFHDYAGDVANLDRWGSAAAKGAEHEAENTANKLGGEADTEHGQLSPFYTNEMNATHYFSPEQTGEMLNYALAGSGGAASSITGQAGLEAARTRNASGFTKSLDEAARERDKAAAGASEGIAAQDIMGTKELNQQGAAGLSGLYGTDLGGQEKAMGLQTADINSAVEAGKSGWLQNMNDTIKAISGAVSAYKQH